MPSLHFSSPLSLPSHTNETGQPLKQQLHSCTHKTMPGLNPTACEDLAVKLNLTRWLSSVWDKVMETLKGSLNLAVGKLTGCS